MRRLLKGLSILSVFTLLLVTPVHAVVGANVPTLSNAAYLFMQLVSVLWALGGVGFLGMLILGGAKWIMSTGDPQKVADAQQTLVWAVIGLIALLSAYFIISLIANLIGYKNWYIVDLSSIPASF